MNSKRKQILHNLIGRKSYRKMRRNAIGKSKQVSSMSEDQKEIRNLKQGYLILNKNQFWKIQACRIITSSKEPNKRQIGKLGNAFNSIENIFNN